MYGFDLTLPTEGRLQIADVSLDMLALRTDALERSALISTATGGPGCNGNCRPGVDWEEVELLTTPTVGSGTVGRRVLDNVNDGDEVKGEAFANACGFGWEAGVGVAPDGWVRDTLGREEREVESVGISIIIGIKL